MIIWLEEIAQSLWNIEESLELYMAMGMHWKKSLKKIILTRASEQGWQ